MTTIDDLIRDVAIKHGVGLRKDDPVLMLHTINEHLARDMQERQDAALAAFRAELERALVTVDVTAKDMAERTVNAAVKAARELLRAEAEASAAAFRSTMEAAAGRTVAGIENAVARLLRPLVLLGAGSAAISVLAVVFIIAALAWA